MKMAGLEEEDELRYLARLLRHTGYCSEINICGRLWTTRVTSHVPLREVAGLITAEKVCAAARGTRSGAEVRWNRRAAHRRGRSSTRMRAKGGLLGNRRVHDRPRCRKRRAEGMTVSRTLPRRYRFRSGQPRRLRRGRDHVSRPGSDRDQASRLRPRRDAAGGASASHHHARAWHRIRHRRQRRRIGGSNSGSVRSRRALLYCYFAIFGAGDCTCCLNASS